MAGLLGEPEIPDVEATDYLGQPSPVAFKAQAALPTVGPAVGSPVGPVTTAGGTTPGDTGGPGPAGIPPGEPSPGVRADGGQEFDPTTLGLNLGFNVGPKLLNIADRLFMPAPGVDFTKTPSGDITFMPNERLRDIQYPEVPEPEIPTAEVPTVPPVVGEVPTLGNVPLSGPIPDDLIALFGGDRGAFEAAFPNVSVTPDQLADMADAGELTGLGIDSAAALEGMDVGSLGNALGIANLLVTGLRMGGVLEGDASTVVGNLLGLVGTGLSGASLTAAIEAGVTPTISTIGGAAGGVLAPFIAWGMNELSRAMRPNVTPIKRRLDEQFYNAGIGEVRNFNTLAERIRNAGIEDPAVLQQLLNAGESAVLDFYNRGVDVGHGGQTVGGGMASASGHVGGFDPVTQGWLMGPIREAMMDLQGLQNALGGQARGSNDWYGIFGGQLNPWSLNEIQGTGSANPLGLNPGQYGEQFTPEQLQAAAGGLTPLDFALQQFAGASPDWNVPSFRRTP